MHAFFGIALQHFADRLLAPLVTLGTIAGGLAILAAIVGKLEALDAEMPPAEEDAHIQSSYNQGLVLGGALALVPVIVLLLEAFS
jgi:hypothetical protein